jgi:predicted metal-dependent HD superfamily phosphohydrolase
VSAVPVPTALLCVLRRRYAETGRAYHTWAHVEALLERLDAEHGLVHDPAALRLAILFHDAVYDPRRADNEERSAILAGTALSGNIDPATLGRVRRAILATNGHRVPDGLGSDEAEDLARFLDWDLSVLGAEPAGFAAYEAGIRSVEPDAYRAGRGTVLRRFLARAPLFLTEPSRGLFEAAARRNLRTALVALGEDRAARKA